MQDTILVSYIDNNDPILIIGRKRLNQSVKVINAFHGDEAKELYSRLVTKKETNNV